MIKAVNWETAVPILPHLGELVAGLLVFGILMWVFAARVAPRLEQIYQERTSAIEGGLKRAEQAQEEADKRLAEYREQLADAREEGNRIREQARAQGADIVAEMRHQAQEEAARITASAQSQLEAERRSAQAQLRSEIGGLATSLAGRIVGESLADEARQRRIVDRFLAELEADETDASGPHGNPPRGTGDPDEPAGERAGTGARAGAHAAGSRDREPGGA